MKTDKNNTEHKEQSHEFVKNLNNVGWFTKLIFHIKDLFSGDPKLTIKVDRKDKKIKIVLFDKHFKLMAGLGLIFIILWGYCLFKAVFANELTDVLRFGLIAIISFVAAAMIIRRAIDYEKMIFNSVDNLVRHQDATNKLFNGMLTGSTKDINDAFFKIDTENKEIVSNFKDERTKNNDDSSSKK